MKLSIVTVCYQAARELEKTLDSVVRQINTDYEYIVQDGGSTDDTSQVAEKYKTILERRGIPFIYRSGKDGGIYDAMNRSLEQVTGEWILFLNAGDCLTDEMVLDDIWKKTIPQDTVILYGNTIELEPDGNYLWRSDVQNLDKRCALCHQSVLIRADWMKAHPYNTEYKIGADYDFFLKTREEGGIFTYVDRVISKITKDGYSNQNEKQRVLETEKIKETYGLADCHSVQYYLLYCQASLKQWMIDYLPASTVQLARRWRRKMRKRDERVSNI
jgi:glycosyltransferase involved in cell wall biosynthesis